MMSTDPQVSSFIKENIAKLFYWLIPNTVKPDLYVFEYKKIIIEGLVQTI